MPSNSILVDLAKRTLVLASAFGGTTSSTKTAPADVEKLSAMLVTLSRKEESSRATSRFHWMRAFAAPKEEEEE